MRDPGNRRLFFALAFALIAGGLLLCGNPANRIKADLRADTRGFVLTLEYSASLFEGAR